MKIKNLIFLVIFLLFIPLKASSEEKNFSITCSLFPVYDFAREIAGNLADVNLILRPGIEPHEFEPSPLDIKKLNNSDVFIFTGIYMEEWAEKISRSLNNIPIINASENIEIFNKDPHIWLDLDKAKKMIMNIAEGLSKAKPEFSEIFYKNAEEYSKKISELDEKFMSLNKKILVFAGEFNFNYFVERYGFEFISAYDGENEPSVNKMAEILKFINDNHVKYIFADSFGISNITRSISEQTGTEILFFNSAEKISSVDFNNGLTFLEIMQKNYQSLKKFTEYKNEK